MGRAPSLTSRDRQIQAFFKASYRGAPVRGIIVVTVENGEGTATLLFDREDQFAKSFPVLSKQMAAAQPKNVPGGLAPLTRTRLPDGSGWVGLPAGWKITGAYKGTTDLVGPNGESMVLGAAQHVFMRGNPNSPIMFGSYRPPWEAWQLHLDFLNKGALSRGEASMRSVEQAPAQSAAGTAAWLAYELTGGSAKFRGLAYVITKPFHDDLGSWFCYASHMNAPAARWPQAMPVMWSIWKSWSVNPAVFRERMDSALQSMRETTQLILDANKYRTHSFANTNYGWDECIRGVTMIENVNSHARAEVDTNHVEWWIAEFQRLGYDVRVVPTMELVP